MPGGESDLYVYGLAEHGMPQSLRIRGHALRILTIGDIDAIVEGRSARVEPTTEALQRQHAIVAEIAARGTLLPARFGSVISESALRSVVDGHRLEIMEALMRVRGRRQMTIRVFGAPDDSIPDAAQAATGTEFLNSRRARARHLPPEVSTIREAVGPLVAAEHVEPGERGLRVTLFHLVAAGMVETYREKASGLQSTLAPRRLTVSGPFPAYAFTPAFL
jgi:hypothetical protein